MREVEPKVFLIGETRVVPEGLEAYLKHVGAAGWSSDAASDAELLAEVYGRSCYRSFFPGLNPNVTRVRGSNREHLGNILAVGHGSVLEHSVLNFMICDVSRVFTHELVRHRAGTAISQESLRFVRLTELGAWVPTVIRESPEVMEVFVRTFQEMERLQVTLAKQLDVQTGNFERKKKLTSAMRRLAPEGVATNIGWSANVRALRHVIEDRTHPGAEEEIRLVFGKVAELVRARYPVLFGDYEAETVDGLLWYRTPHRKV
ncbi:MAG: FAD-dependent thymidylate synthase [Chloroflexi bacterium]|nr:FAD-dependent thymidylate synthase [Chloroflexota bacterium]